MDDNYYDDEEEDGDDGDINSTIEPVTTGRASWDNDKVVMGGMTFIPNEACTIEVNLDPEELRRRRRHHRHFRLSILFRFIVR